MISVCMATHNGEQYIHRQLTSILGQLGPQDELIITDDSSTDTTVEIINSFSDARIRLLTENTFFSPIYNFENALKHASGEIIALADQDDIWLDNKMDIIRQELVAKADQPALIMMNGHIIDEAGERTGQTIFSRKRPSNSLLLNLYDNRFTGCALAFTSKLLELALPFPKGIPMHDSWLGMLALLIGEVAFIEKKTMEYRRHSTNLSQTHSNPLVQIRWRLFLGYHLAHRYFLWKVLKDK